MSELHVAPSDSAAGSLRLAWQALGRHDRVIGICDQLSIGPIDGADPQTRLAWIEEELGWEPVPHQQALLDAFWAEVASYEGAPIVWMSRRSTKEYCCFLEVLWRRRDLPLRIVDVTDIDRRAAFSHIGDREIIERRLVDRVADLPDIDRARHLRDWQRLRTENAALRIVGPTGLRSAPISHFDDLLRSHTPTDWTPFSWVVGSVYSTDDRFDLHSFELLSGRMFTLIDEGEIESRGDDSSYRTIQVRRH